MATPKTKSYYAKLGKKDAADGHNNNQPTVEGSWQRGAYAAAWESQMDELAMVSPAPEASERMGGISVGRKADAVRAKSVALSLALVAKRNSYNSIRSLQMVRPN